jgi:hypothetical protein
MAAPDDAKGVLSAFRLGWYFAEMRGRNRPGGPPGSSGHMPDHIDHALPLRSERSYTELQIVVQSVVAQLAKELHVDDADDGTSFTAVLADKAKLLSHVRAREAVVALHRALGLLQPGGVLAGDGKGPLSAPERALEVLQQGLAAQQAVVVERQQAVAAAQQVQAGTRQHPASERRHPDQAEAARAKAETAMQLKVACRDREAHEAAVLEQVIAGLAQAIAASPDSAAQAGITCIRQGQLAIGDPAHQAWADLAELIWLFDAHIQGRLTAISETQAIGYQLGRGLAETYWALDPEQYDSSTGWAFLLGEERCRELSRLTGRLAAYMGEYTAPAIAGSLNVWKDVASNPSWRGYDAPSLFDAQDALYEQLSIWYQLVALGQDPIALIRPGMRLKSFYVATWAVRFFSGRLTLAVIGVAGLIVSIYGVPEIRVS